MSVFLLTHVGDQFCLMIKTEKEAKCEALALKEEDGGAGDQQQQQQPAAGGNGNSNNNIQRQQQIAWKRVVQGVREMCDVCETTLFNFHWACGKCGYVVCIDCYKSRRKAQSPTRSNGSNSRDDEVTSRMKRFIKLFHPSEMLLLLQHIQQIITCQYNNNNC